MIRLGPVVATAMLPTTSGLLESARAAFAAGADRVEVRLDGLAPGEEIGPLLELAEERPMLFSGARDAVRPEEIPVLRRAQAAGAWVDLPFSPQTPEALFGLLPERLVLSWHDQEGTPSDLQGILLRMRQRPAAVYKLVPTARDFPDAASVLDLLAREGSGGDLCAFAMGTPGLPTRILALARGSAAVYASAPGCPPGAPGQLPLTELLGIYRPAELRPGEPLYLLAGWPLRSTRSPALFNAWLGLAGLPGRYLPLPASDLAPLFSRWEGSFAGMAVTIPHKEAVLAYLASTSRLVRLLGACNTLVHGEAGWCGANTDVFGVRRALRAVPRGSRCLLLGAGGAAAAAALALRRIGPTAVAGRDFARTRAFARRFGLEAMAWEERGAASWDLLVNATPLGQEGEETPLPARALPGSWVFDMVVRPGGTPLVRQALALGLQAIPGEAMLVPQARLQFRLWTGRRPPRRRSPPDGPQSRDGSRNGGAHPSGDKALPP
jgi:shikimate dehydrogenase